MRIKRKNIAVAVIPVGILLLALPPYVMWVFQMPLGLGFGYAVLGMYVALFSSGCWAAHWLLKD